MPPYQDFRGETFPHTEKGLLWTVTLMQDNKIEKIMLELLIDIYTTEIRAFLNLWIIALPNYRYIYCPVLFNSPHT